MDRPKKFPSCRREAQESRRFGIGRTADGGFGHPKDNRNRRRRLALSPLSDEDQLRSAGWLSPGSRGLTGPGQWRERRSEGWEGMLPARVGRATARTVSRVRESGKERPERHLGGTAVA